MTGRAFWFLIVASCVVFAGCGKPAESNPPAESNAPATETTSVSLAPQQVAGAASSTPQEAVAAFFAAFRDGDEQTVSALLTTKARDESERNGVAINPPGNDAATFSVGEVEYVEPDGAHVAGSWTETTADGTQTIDIVWILRQEPGGWRIAGLAARAQDQNVVYNFEDSEEMQQRRREAEYREQAVQPETGQVREAYREATPSDSTTLR